ncbi:hypothetical protein IT415_02735 [bacterium]|nr:hypothetical protein [bacterium]
MKFRRVSRGWLLVVVLGVVFSSVMTPQVASASEIGENSWAQPWVDAYNRIGGAAAIGYPENAVHRWNSGCIQDFGGGKYIDAALMSPGCQTHRVYSVINTRWWYVARVGSNQVGYPQNESYRWGAGWNQDFDGGWWGPTFLMRGDRVGQTYSVHHGMRGYYISIGGPGSYLGYPKSDEYHWNSFVRQDFEGGSLTWRSDQGVRPLQLMTPREQAAVGWVIAEKNSPDPTWSDQFGRPWSGYCEGFVEVAFGTRGRAWSSDEHYAFRLARGQIHTDTNPPAGVFVFYSGHVGLSIGNGQVISTQGFNGQRLPVWQHSVTGLKNAYLGWARFDGAWPR